MSFCSVCSRMAIGLRPLIPYLCARLPRFPRFSSLLVCLAVYFRFAFARVFVCVFIFSCAIVTTPHPPSPSPASHQILHAAIRSEEHTSELQSLMRHSYAVFCLKKNNKT